MFEDFNIKSKDKYYLLALLIFSSITVVYYINFNLKVGISCSDVYVYLLNALYYTGINHHSTNNIYLSPIICFLTSILFRFGLVDKLAIFIVTGLFAILGNIGVYLLFRQFFDENLSICGAVIYLTTSLSLTWLANGTLDVPAVGMTVWFALLCIIAIDRNPKFYMYAIPVFVIGFFTRYTLVLTVIALVLYYIYRKGFHIEKDSRKYLAIGIAIGVILAAIILTTIVSMGNGQLGVTSQITGGIAGRQGAQTDPAYNTELGYYLVNMPNFISNSHTFFQGNPVLESPTILSGVIFAILIIGGLLWIKDQKIKIERKHILPLAVILIGILTYTRVSSVLTTLIIVFGLYLIGKDSENKTGYMMFAWILANFIFFSYYHIKVNRYILPIFPALIYFTLKAVSIIQDNVKINRNIIPIILIALFAVQGFAFTYTFEPTDIYNTTEEMSQYLKSVDPNYENVEIGVYNIRPYLWWIGDNVEGIPIVDQAAIDKSNMTYYISNAKMKNLTNYTEIKNINNLHLYNRTSY